MRYKDYKNMTFLALSIGLMITVFLLCYLGGNPLMGTGFAFGFSAATEIIFHFFGGDDL